jgi:hypothetical protein
LSAKVLCDLDDFGPCEERRGEERRGEDRSGAGMALSEIRLAKAA